MSELRPPRHTIRVTYKGHRAICSGCGREVGWVAFEAGKPVAGFDAHGPDIRRPIVSFLRHLGGAV